MEVGSGMELGLGPGLGLGLGLRARGAGAAAAAAVRPCAADDLGLGLEPPLELCLEAGPRRSWTWVKTGVRNRGKALAGARYEVWASD